MPVVELGDICEFLDHRRKPVSEEFRKSGPYPYYGANGQQGWIDSYIFDEPLVLLAEDGGHFGSTTKSIAYQISGKTWVNNHAHVLRPGAQCDIDYLTHALSFYDVSKLIGGTTRPKLTKGNAEVIKLPLPDLAEQKRIAGRLEQADRLRRTHRYALELSDTFLPAAFLELFGDPIKNSNEFPISRLENLIEPDRPITYGILMPGPDVLNGVPYIRVTDIQDGQIVNVGIRRTTKEIDQAYKRSRLKSGDLLLTIRGQVGRLAIVRSRLNGANITQDTARLAPTDRVSAYYLMGCLGAAGMQHRMADLTRGAAVQGINLGDIKELPIPVPPLALQAKFALLVVRTARLRLELRESLRQVDHLFQSLLDRAFH